mmetsp:Transcript_26915/g.59148  ORF Transcript_26915/g.59148 Transcript_26915/m.59148 type:complete len:601 (-) Transcript_26915:350-2152(-)
MAQPDASHAELTAAGISEEFGVQAGEVDKLQMKWSNWSEDIEENKRLVLEDVDEVVEVTPFSGIGASLNPVGLRPRSRTADCLIASCPVFYGWIMAALVALGALIISPAQVYSVGVVLDNMLGDLKKENKYLSRLGISTLYASAHLIASPVILLHTGALAMVSRKTLVTLSGLLFCVSCLLLAMARGPLSLLLIWTLQQLVGPGMLYPALELTLLYWWKARRDRVSAVVQSVGALLGMLLLPMVLSFTACEGECWRPAYTSLGVGLLVPVLLIALLVVEGGALDHDLGLDGASSAAGSMHAAADTALTDTAPSESMALETPSPPVADERWSLHEALTHTSFWLAQVTFSTVHAIVNAFIFHRKDLLTDYDEHFPDDQADARRDHNERLATNLLVLVALSCMVCTPAGLFVRRKEKLLILALLLVAGGILTLVHHPTSNGLYISSVLMGGAFGVTNGYSTAVWEYLFGRSDAERIKHTSIAITSATSGSAIWAFAFSRQETKRYRASMNAMAAVALMLATVDMLALAKPELLEAIVRRAPTWEQLLARRQRVGYFSVSGQLASIGDAFGRCVCSAPWSRTARRNQANPIETEIPPLENRAL